ncbi:glyoxalase [Mucilaginibacter achroorhodeus]|uniref:Glyoxalase n=1 Tax=Mucilaginibacter achroorhodeus TaxID=2599294 RepID=A0A563TY29_9SPHI|nr:VOC family protein [Mucilaginibacter achroorhodeus]TWR24255.1 glyoxalase [Mucilaginibacter achroorhodeus]
MESLSPNIFVTDIKQTVNFYKILGFTTEMTVPEDGEHMVWAMMKNGKVTFMFQTLASLDESDDNLPHVSRTNGGSLLLYISVKDIKALFDRIKNKVTVLKALEKTFYGATEFTILDNNNYVLTFAEHDA